MVDNLQLIITSVWPKWAQKKGVLNLQLNIFWISCLNRSKVTSHTKI